MSLIIKDTAHLPPEDWIYLVEQTGFTVRTKNYSMFYPEIVKHCQSNNAPIPSEQDVINFLCENVTVPCYEGMTPLVNKFTAGVFKLPSVGCCGKLG